MRSLFLPSVETRARSLLLQHHLLASYVFFGLALLFSASIITSGAVNILGYAADINVNDLLEYTNSRRNEVGAGSVAIDPELSKAAQAKANHMFENDYWAHNSPDGKEPWDFIRAAGYEYLYAGENLAVDFSHSESVVDAWLASPSHKANLLNDKYSDIGFAVVDGELNGRKTTLVVQMFGYPRTQVAVLPEPLGVIDEALVEVPTEIPLEVSEFQVEESARVAQTVLNASDVFSVSKYLAIILGLFLSLLFVIDGYYVRRLGTLRISGHTILHVTLLLLAIAGIWYTNIGLVL